MTDRLQFIQSVLDDASEHIPEGDYLKAMNDLKWLFEHHNRPTILNSMPAVRHFPPPVASVGVPLAQSMTGWLNAVFNWNGTGQPPAPPTMVAPPPAPAPAPPAPAPPAPAPDRHRRSRHLSDLPNETRLWFDSRPETTFWVVNGLIYLSPAHLRNPRHTGFQTLRHAAQCANIPINGHGWNNARVQAPESNLIQPIIRVCRLR